MCILFLTEFWLPDSFNDIIQVFDHDPNILLYFQTYNNTQHLRYFECWQKILENDSFLKGMDVTVYFGDTVGGEKFNDTFQNFPNEKKTFIENRNPGYQEGAILAFRYGFQHELFNSYDWVIRLNSDVLIYNSYTLQTMMQNRTTCGIFSNCYNNICENRCLEGLIMTDFTVFRPKCLNNTEVLEKKGESAENHATGVFRKIIFDAKDQWIFKHNFGSLVCRVNWVGKHSGDIEHRHDPCKIK